MPAGFAEDDARAAFRDAIHAIEGASSAEIVVAVRRQSASWLHAHLIVGIVAGIAASAYMLFSSSSFGTVALFVDPLVAGAAAGLVSTQVLPIKRWLTPARIRRRAVRRAARAAFVERGIRRTSGMTGVLVYVSVAERMAELVPDDGVAAAAPDAEWRAACAAVDAAVARGGVATARALAALAPVLGAVLPRAEDDVNELPDDLHVGEADA